MTSPLKQLTKYIPVALIFFSQITPAAPGMSEQQMQQMQQRMLQAQECFNKLDKSKFDELEAKGKKMEAEIKALCKAGKRDKAMSTAMKYGQEMHNDPQLKAMRKCGEHMQGMMDNMPGSFSPPTSEEKDGHICDDM
ncbi:hypothetical protein [Candidatus Thiodiazotropha sp. CDECU1]|uniref:hypothetical protein n=1 Tax=Candidatus Thiodiazotropha sp. CDECU1 TaxID=3065865 RepID=UPI00292E55F5|nr:hypothetical protein [Candidatus Thiodiazotropha sp. CDECU1]